MPGLVEEVTLETAVELVQEMLPIAGRIWSAFRGGAAPEEWVFRGQRDASWPLCPAAFRPGAFARFAALDVPDHPVGLTDAQRREFHHVRRFVMLADSLGFHIPGDAPALRDNRPRRLVTRHGVPIEFFPQTEYLYMFALAQHYGIPTRLLDWTYKPMAAAYFAAAGTPGSPAPARLAVWALRRGAVERQLGADAWRDDNRDVLVSFITAPTASNPNLAAQAGMFTLVHDSGASNDSIRTLDEVIVDSAAVFADERAPVAYKFTLPSSQVPRLLRLLAAHDIHAGSIYPGLAGAAMALRETVLHG